MPQVISKATNNSSKSAGQYQAETLAALQAQDKSGTNSQAITAPAQTVAKADDGATGTEPKTDPPGNKPEEKKDEESKLPENIKVAFEKITAEKAEMRKMKESVAQEMKAMKEIASQAQALMDAKTPMELLRAKGFAWKDAVEEMTGIRPEGDETPAPKEEKKLKLEDIDPDAAKDLAEWRKERAERAQIETRKSVKTAMEDFAKKAGDKFKMVMKLEEIDKAIDFIDQHWRKHGELPGTSFAESAEIALAHVEADLQSQAKKWQSVLTPGPEGGTQDPAAENRESAAPQATSDQALQSSKTLTTKAGAPRSGPSPEPKTTEEYRAAALAELIKLDKA